MKLSRFYLFVLFFLLGNLENCFSQDSTPASYNNFKFYSTKDGFYAEKTGKIVQDSMGFLWFGTTDGLYKYDGTLFSAFDKEALNSPILSTSILCLFNDSKNDLWIGTNEGLVHYNHLTSVFSKIKALDNKYIIGIVEDKNKKIWVATHGGVYIVEDKLTVSKVYFNSFFCQGIFVNPTLPNKVVVIASNKVNFIDISTRSIVEEIVYSESKEFTTENAIVDANNQIWIGRLNGEVIKIDCTTKKKELFDFKNIFGNPSATALGFFNNSKDKVWICVDEIGIVYYDYAKKSFVSFETKKQNHLPSYKVTSFFIDREKNYWFGMDKNGIGMTNSYLNSFNFLENSIFEKNRTVSSILKDSNNNLWIGTDGGGILMFDANNKLIKKFTNNPYDNASLSNDVVHSIYEDSKKRIWVGTYKGGLSLYNKQLGKFTHFQAKEGQLNGLLRNDIRKIKEDNKGNLWLVVQGKGVTCYNPEKNSFVNYDKLSATGQWTNDILIAKNEAVWVTSSSGLFRKLKNESRFIQLDKEKKQLLESYVNCLFEDNSEKIWIGSLHGLYFYDEKINKLVKIGLSPLLSSSSVRSINQDQFGNFLVATNIGLFRYNYKLQTIDYFGLEDGLRDQNFIINASYKTDKNLYLGTSNGFCWFDPASLGKINSEASIYLTDIKVKNASIQFDKKYNLDVSVSLLKQLELDYNENYLTFDFAYPSYIIGSSKLNYEYRLEGFDNQWQLGKGQKSITFTSIPPGNYVLTIRNINSSFQKNERHALAFKLIINPPFYQTWWFRSLVVLSILLLGYLYLKLKTKQLSAMNKLLEEKIKERTSEIQLKNEVLEQQRKELEIANLTKDKLFSIIAHDLRSPFTTILSMADYLSEHFKSSSNSKVQEITQGIYKASKNAYQVLENLLQWAQFQTGRLTLVPEWIIVHKEIESIIDANSLQCLDKNITIEFDPKRLFSAYIDRVMFDTIIRNLVTNAIKFSNSNDNIFISIDSNSKGFDVTIADKGVGMNEQTINEILNKKVSSSSKGTSGELGTGLGLMVVKEFLQVHQSKWTIESKENVGTTMHLEFHSAIREVENLETQALVDLNFKQNNELTTPAILDEKTLFFLKGKQALVVDDQEDIRKAIILQLGDKLDIIEASNGKEALVLAKENLPDIIISDVMMPEMNGIEFSFKIKNEINTAHIPVILLTAQNEEKDVILGLESGVDDYLLKPFNASILLLKIANLLLNREKLKKKFGLDDAVLLESIKVDSLDRKLFDKIQECITNNISNEDFSVEILSAEIGMHRSNLTKKISSLTGMTPNELIKTQRMKLAAKLILASGKNVSEVAYEVGFSDPKYFSKSFKKYFGVLPTEYSESIKG